MTFDFVHIVQPWNGYYFVHRVQFHDSIIVSTWVFWDLSQPCCYVAGIYVYTIEGKEGHNWHRVACRSVAPFVMLYGPDLELCLEHYVLSLSSSLWSPANQWRAFLLLFRAHRLPECITSSVFWMGLLSHKPPAECSEPRWSVFTAVRQIGTQTIWSPSNTAEKKRNTKGKNRRDFSQECCW